MSADRSREAMLDLLTKGESLRELLGILRIIGDNLETKNANPRAKYYRYSRFIFFGLLVKARSLRESMEFKSEHMQGIYPELAGVHLRLKEFARSLDEAFSLVKNNKLDEGKAAICLCEKEYAAISKEVKRIAVEKLA